MPRHITETARQWKDPHPEGVAKYYVPPGRYTREDILAIVRTAWRDQHGDPKWDDLDTSQKCSYFDTAVAVCNQGIASSPFEKRILKYRNLWDKQKENKHGNTD